MSIEKLPHDCMCQIYSFCLLDDIEELRLVSKKINKSTNTIDQKRILESKLKIKKMSPCIRSKFFTINKRMYSMKIEVLSASCYAIVRIENNNVSDVFKLGTFLGNIDKVDDKLLLTLYDIGEKKYQYYSINIVQFLQ